MYLSQITDPDSIFMARKTSENFRNLSVIVFVLFIFSVQKNGLKVGCLTILKIYFTSGLNICNSGFIYQYVDRL